MEVARALIGVILLISSDVQPNLTASGVKGSSCVRNAGRVRCEAGDNLGYVR